MSRGIIFHWIELSPVSSINNILCLFVIPYLSDININDKLVNSFLLLKWYFWLNNEIGYNLNNIIKTYKRGFNNWKNSKPHIPLMISCQERQPPASPSSPRLAQSVPVVPEAYELTYLRSFTLRKKPILLRPHHHQSSLPPDLYQKSDHTQFTRGIELVISILALILCIRAIVRFLFCIWAKIWKMCVQSNAGGVVGWRN